MNLTSQAVLDRDGLIARRLTAYEHRPEQLQMAEAIAAAIAERSHLLVEAGTGVGKSFAYLVPVILAAASRTAPEGERRPIIVSTHTISLQEQLIGKDIPFLNAVLPVEFSAVLVKGRSNYVSLRRLRASAERSVAIFAEPSELDHLRRLVQWSRKTTEGSLADLPFTPLPQVWDEVRSEHGNCLGRKCPTYADCHYYAARRRVWNADVLVVNHALFFADLALRRDGASVLPDYDVVVLDEAHTIEAVASEHLGLSVSSGQITYALNRLYNDRTHKGLLLHHHLVDCQKLVQRLRYVGDDFFHRMQEWLTGQGREGNGRVRAPLQIDSPLPGELRELASSIATQAQEVADDTQRVELTSAAERLTGLSQSLSTWLAQSQEDSVYWVESSGRRKQNIGLVCAPIDVSPLLRAELFQRAHTVVLTSATLSVGDGDFGYVRKRIGLTHSPELRLGSPFDYRVQARLVLATQMPDPAEQPADFERAASVRVQRHVLETSGRAFVLFTSYRMLEACAERLSDWFTQEHLTLLCQGIGGQRSALLERFRRNPRAVLFGTESFWQGVDVPGDALQNVIITRLPFSVPDHPLLQARVERIRERGGNPFLEYQIPEAVIKLRQGFGRLIRSKSDTGQVVILDPRVRTKPYGRVFLSSLPRCRVYLDNGTECLEADVRGMPARPD